MELSADKWVEIMQWLGLAVGIFGVVAGVWVYMTSRRSIEIALAKEKDAMDRLLKLQIKERR